MFENFKASKNYQKRIQEARPLIRVLNLLSFQQLPEIKFKHFQKVGILIPTSNAPKNFSYLFPILKPPTITQKNNANPQVLPTQKLTFELELSFFG
jgi:hypothetical protein